MEKSSEARKPRAVLVPLPFQGHLTPMLQLGSILHSRGFSIIVAHTEFNSPNPENHPEFTFVPLSDGLAGYDTSLRNLLKVISVINKNFKSALEDYLLEEKESEVPVDCIIHDSLMHCVNDVSDHLNIPRIFFRCSMAAYMQSYQVILNLHEHKLVPLPESKLEDPVPGLTPIIRYKDLPLSVTSDIPETVLEFLQNFSKTITSTSAVIWNSVEMLDHYALYQLQQQYQVPFFPIGPFHKMAPSSQSTSLIQEDDNCIAWLDTREPKSVLYVSLGSLATMEDKQLREIAWGLAHSGQPFLWVVRPSSVDGSEWIECLPVGFQEATRGRGLIVKWAPQKKVLEHRAVGGFFSHCGWNSTLESVCQGVPMICRPCFADQIINARFLVHEWKVGLELEDEMDRGSIHKVIRMLMVNEQGIEIRQRAAELKRRLQLCTKTGGSSCNSLDDLVTFIKTSLTKVCNFGF